MSALSVAEIAVHVRRRLGLPPSAALRFQPLVAQALKSLARGIAVRDDYTEAQKDANASCVNGVIAVSDATLLLDTLAPPRGSLYIGGVIAKPARSLEATRDRSHYWYRLSGRTIEVADVGTGALGAAGGAGGLAAVLTANYEFTLPEMPSRYDEELISEVERLARGGAGRAE